MSRWKPDAVGRLEKAAYELFNERGYEQATVAEIAARAGLTERTFFRHYADKREVFFSGSATLKDELVRTLDALPSRIPPMQAVRIAVGAMSKLMHGRRALARERQNIVIAHADLQERSLIKRATLTAALTAALEERGEPAASASLAADMGMAVFYVGFERWLDDPAGRELDEVVDEGFDQLKAIASAT